MSASSRSVLPPRPTKCRRRTLQLWTLILGSMVVAVLQTAYLQPACFEMNFAALTGRRCAMLQTFKDGKFEGNARSKMSLAATPGNGDKDIVADSLERERKDNSASEDGNSTTPLRLLFAVSIGLVANIAVRTMMGW
eukprot:TRINITY_DN52083_c0_g1_i1.p1 TRINITY_DN52083_c0_g1~~TRINITY_DN52083_c0_g1_i1.p1  ORF type:complete len:137 (+),score=27.04 TRINITY_DN52083_c0_g1_i1:98-508(+)